MSSSPTMSGRSLHKVPSSDNVCPKFKDDRGRNNNNNTTKYKQKETTLNPPKTFNKLQKQARARGNQHYNGGRRNQMTEQQRDEFSSFTLDNNKCGKKINLNHLLNFSYDATIDTAANLGYVPKGNNLRRNANVFNKEQFIQANCQMVMLEGPDYTIHQHDVDLPLEWNLIQKVNMWNTEPPSCPICLYPPTIPKITKCGHIYCWPCILHYLALGDEKKSWKKCPICHEAVQQKDLKSVTMHEEMVHDNQSMITMKLMKRFKGTNTCMEAYDNEANGTEKNKDFNSEIFRNKKYLVAKPSDILINIIQVEREQLEFKLATEEDELEKTFITLALDLNKAYELELKDKIQDEVKNVENNTTADINETTKVHAQQELEKPTTSDRIYYFYQAEDGQHIYIHPLNVKCLVHQYRSFDRCPSTINARIIESDRISVNEATRKRYRYLSHLPLSLEIHMVELDLRPPIVSMATLATFRDMLERRQAQRRKKAREEKRILRKAFNEDLRKQGKYPSAHISLNNQKQFPQIQQQQTSGSFSVLLSNPHSIPGNEAFMTSHDKVVTSQEPSMASQSNVTSGASSSVGSLEIENVGPSFAQMLKSTNSNHDLPTWPRLSNRTSTSSVTSQVVPNDEDPDYVAPPTYKSSFGDALCSALDQIDVTSSAGKGEKSKKKKGKKGKKVLLFSTASQLHQ